MFVSTLFLCAAHFVVGMIMHAYNTGMDLVQVIITIVVNVAGIGQKVAVAAIPASAERFAVERMNVRAAQNVPNALDFTALRQLRVARSVHQAACVKTIQTIALVALVPPAKNATAAADRAEATVGAAPHAPSVALENVHPLMNGPKSWLTIPNGTQNKNSLKQLL
eukprot:TRINITY_DN7913_c0_g1_i1.p2 TRINITY_DN7913_c0_g1~~TRINITY_DN7913_c0_g1_i1.p2  ORF type:complete len:166 (-),score=23.45 TRINITY_DN7913_c0_g1_i1:122-619(-)